jgi:hypothetical protein
MIVRNLGDKTYHVVLRCPRKWKGQWGVDAMTEFSFRRCDNAANVPEESHATSVDRHEPLAMVADRLEAALGLLTGQAEEKQIAGVEKLLTEARSYLDRWRQLPGATASRLIIDRSTFTVSYKGRPCSLGNTLAFRLIERFAKSPGTYIHLDTVKIEVWNDEYAEDEAVQRQISTLRKKLKKAGIKNIIETEVGGYYRLMSR